MPFEKFHSSGVVLGLLQQSLQRTRLSILRTSTFSIHNSFFHEQWYGYEATKA